MEVTGKIVVILPANHGVSQRTGNSWSSQQFVLETNEQYPKKIPFEVFGEDRIRQFDLHVDETVTIFFDIDGREYKGRWYPSIKCYNVVKQGQQTYTQQPQQPQQAAPQPQPAPNYSQQPYTAPQPEQGSDNADDLPFR